MEAKFIQSISEIAASDWDSCVPASDPFSNHAFLYALEESKSVTRQTGWDPLHLLLYEKESLVAAAPLYVKMHSYGEYIFDWGWAEGAQRSGLTYYPKLLNAVPFTPATGGRLLTQNPKYKQALWSIMQRLAEQIEASSAHVLFLPEADATLCDKVPNTISRLSYQFHWENPNVESFEEWLSLFRAKSRKNIIVERKKAQAGVDCIYALRGHELTPKHIDKMWSFYCDTIDRKWGKPYLTRDFFSLLRTTLATQTIVFFAEKNGAIIASSLCFQRGEKLFGRYWGCSEHVDFLHFELCYHQPIELCLKNKWCRFEAGAQGQHKLKRGLIANATHSVHHLCHPGLHAAVKRAVQQENQQIRAQIRLQNQHAPFKCSS